MTASAVYVAPGNNIRLDCQVDSNLAQVNWHFNGQPLQTTAPKHFLYNQGLLIFNSSASDMGDYTCQAIEHVGAHEYPQVLASYQLLPPQATTPPTGQGDQSDQDQEVSFTEPPVSQITAPKKKPAGGSGELSPDQPLPNAQVRKITGLQVAVAVLTVTLVAVIGFALFFSRQRLRSRLQKARRTTKNGTAYQPASQDKTDNPRTDQNCNDSVNTVTFSRKGTSNGPAVAIASIGEESEI